MTPEQLSQLVEELEKLTRPSFTLDGPERFRVLEEQRKYKIEQAFPILLNVLKEYIAEKSAEAAKELTKSEVTE